MRSSYFKNNPLIKELEAEAKAASAELPEGPSMYDLVDVTNRVVIARHESYRALCALHYIQFANVDATIFGEGSNRSWSQFDANALLDILVAVKGKPLGPHIYPYNDLLTHVRKQVEAAEWLRCPYKADELIKQACRIDPSDATPMRFNPDGDEPLSVKKWTMDPQIKRARRESGYSTGFLNQGIGEGLEETAPVVSPAPRAPKEKAPRPAKEPRAPRAPKGADGRPDASSKTGMVWVIADRVRAAHKKATGKDLRKLVVDACLAEGVNQGTASVQFGKWKAANGL